MSLKNRKTPIWRQREPTHMSLSRTDGLKKFGIPNDSLGIFNDKFKESEIISMSLIWPRVTWLPSKLWNRNRDSKHLTWVRERAPPCWKSYRPFGRSRASQSKPCSPPGGPGTSPGCGAVPKRPSKVWGGKRTKTLRKCAQTCGDSSRKILKDPFNFKVNYIL